MKKRIWVPFRWSKTPKAGWSVVASPQGFFFDGGFVTEEIVNQGIIDDPLDAHLVQEYIEYHLNEADVWEDRFAPGGHGVIFQYSVEPEAIKTEDGYVFNRQPNGRYTDGDMEWPSFKEFRETAHVEWKNVQGGFDV